MTKLTMTMNEAAEVLGVSLHTVRDKVASGEIPSVRISPRRIVIPTDLLHDWLRGKALNENA